MGTTALFASQQALTYPRSQVPRGNAIAREAVLRTPSAAPVVAQDQSPALTLDNDPAQAIARQFDGIVYRSRVQQNAIALHLQQSAQKLTQPGPDAVIEQSVQQLGFNFFTESRSEELVLFRERTAEIASGIGGHGGETLIQASRRVAARFEFSLSISSTTLNAFTQAAGQGGADGAKELARLSDSLLAKADNVINKIFSLLDSFFKGDASVDDLQADINKLLEDFGNFTFPGIPSPGAAAAQGARTAQRIQIEFEFSFSLTVESETVTTEVQQADPLVFDLDGDGIELTSHTGGANFDILGNGQRAQVAFVTGGDAFLAIDRNGNGAIDDGRELFGDQGGAANGFEALRALDANADGLVNALDPQFHALRLFRDNGDGRTGAGELISLADAGIAEIDLNYINANLAASGGNRIAQLGSFTRTDGSRGVAADALLNFTV